VLHLKKEIPRPCCTGGLIWALQVQQESILLALFGMISTAEEQSIKLCRQNQLALTCELFRAAARWMNFCYCPSYNATIYTKFSFFTHPQSLQKYFLPASEALRVYFLLFVNFVNFSEF
jgi:hypothetical protein